MNTSLLVGRDDRPAIRRALESAGFLVFEASDGGRDLERLRAFWAALILLDVPMPRVRGMEILRSLRGAGDDIPGVIVVTHGRIPATIEAVRLGAIEVLVRPLTTEALHAAVDEILHRAAEARPGPARPGIFFAVEPSTLDLLRAKQAMDHRKFIEAERLLLGILNLDPDSAVAHNLMGVLHERLGEHYASYHSFRAALRADREYEPAIENLRRHCERFGLDFLRLGLIPVARRRDRASDPGP